MSSRGNNREIMWRQMLKRSFDPREWYLEDESQAVPLEGISMWVYRDNDDGQYEVGFFTPTKEWVKESVHPTREEAAQRTHFLNGGHGTTDQAVSEAASKGFSGT